MSNVKKFLKITAAAMLISGSAHASEAQQPKKSKLDPNGPHEAGLLYIPHDINIKIKKTPQLDLETFDDYDTDYNTEIKYDLLGNMEADLGLIKTKNVKSRYRVRSGALPRGHYFKPINSKLGAKLSTRF